MDYTDIYQGLTVNYLGVYDTFCKGYTLLMRLCWNGMRNIHRQEIKEYLDQYPGEINKQNEEGWSALMIAIYNNKDRSQIDTIKLLLEYSADVTLKNNCGKTALHIASENCKSGSNFETIQVLLENGSDPNTLDNYQQTSLTLALINNFYKNNTKTIEILLKYNANPNIHTINGFAIFMIPIEHSDPKTIKLLLRYNANPNIRNSFGCTPLMVAIDKNTCNEKIIKILLKNCVDTKARDLFGHNALGLAHTLDKKRKNKNIIKLLRKKNMKQLININKILKEKNELLKKKLNGYYEGVYILELYNVFKDY